MFKKYGRNNCGNNTDAQCDGCGDDNRIYRHGHRPDQWHKQS